MNMASFYSGKSLINQAKRDNCDDRVFLIFGVPKKRNFLSVLLFVSFLYLITCEEFFSHIEKSWENTSL